MSTDFNGITGLVVVDVKVPDSKKPLDVEASVSAALILDSANTAAKKAAEEAGNSKTSAEAAAGSATAAANSAGAASDSKTAAAEKAGSMDAKVEAAAGSATAAANSAGAASDSKTAAAGSAEAAAASAAEAKAATGPFLKDSDKGVANGVAGLDSGAKVPAANLPLGYLLLQRNASYAVGDLVYTSTLGSRYYLECVTAGVTANVEPELLSANVGG